MAEASGAGVEIVNEFGPGVPPLPENASPEEKDRHWYAHVYQKGVPQLTLRAVLMGGVIGALMSTAHIYTVMKLGWSFGVAITACVISYVTWNAIRKLTGNRLSQMTMLENNCMQSTASAAGYSTGSIVVTAFGSLLLINGKHDPWHIVLMVTFFTAALGCLLAVPLKRQVINNERLKFPSGVAAAETLRSLYSEGKEAMQKAYTLIAGLAFGLLIGVLTKFGTVMDALEKANIKPKWLDSVWNSIHIPEAIPSKGFVQHNGKPLQAFSFEPSVLLIGAGMITGPRVSFSMLFGACLLYFGFAPWLIGVDGPPPVFEAGTEKAVITATMDQFNLVHNIPLNKTGTMYRPTQWGLWAGTAIMVMASLTALAMQWKTLLRAFKSVKAAGGASDETAEARSVEVPMKWVIVGLIPVTIALVAIQYLAFQMNFALGLLAVVMSAVVSLVCVRAVGETDTAPTGAMGKVMQLTYAGLSPGNVTHNLMSAGVASSAGSAAADLMTDLKSGFLLGANPRKQFIAQFIGVVIGSLAIVPAWYLMVPDADTLDGYNPPATNMWKAVADALTKGLDKLPDSVRWEIVIGALLGVVLTVIDRLSPASVRKYLPSAMGLGLSWVVTFNNALSFALGAAIVMVWTAMSRQSSDKYNVPLASGLIAGESLVGAFIAIAATAIGLIYAKAATGG